MKALHGRKQQGEAMGERENTRGNIASGQPETWSLLEGYRVRTLLRDSMYLFIKPKYSWVALPPNSDTVKSYDHDLNTGF